MAYEKQTWQTGDTITAEKLNHIEDGIGNSGGSDALTVIFSTSDSGNTYTANKTFQEVHEAASNCVPIFGYFGPSDGPKDPISFIGSVYLPDDDYGGAYFSTTNYSDGFFEVQYLNLNLDNTVTFSSEQYVLTPYIGD